MNEDRISIRQIAEAAGVSVATVSRVIHQNGRFSPETEKRVKDIIRKYHYVPNASAQGLRTSKTPVIGIIVPDILNNHFAGLVLELETNFFRSGFSTVVCNANESHVLELKHVETLLAQNVAGIVFVSGGHYFELGVEIPALYLDRRPVNAWDPDDMVLIESDNEEGGYLAACKVLEKGSRRPAIVMTSNIDYNHRARYAGYCRALDEAGADGRNRVIDVIAVTVEDAQKAVGKALDRGMQTDAIVCTSDLLAIGAIRALRERGLRVPEDVMVTGFDDTLMAQIYHPEITSVHQSVDRMAACAVEQMLSSVEIKERRGTHIVLPVHLVERASTDRK